MKLTLDERHIILSAPLPTLPLPPRAPPPHLFSFTSQLYGLESQGKVGGASKELEEAGAPKDPEESTAPAEVEEEEEPKADLGGAPHVE